MGAISDPKRQRNILSFPSTVRNPAMLDDEQFTLASRGKTLRMWLCSSLYGNTSQSSLASLNADKPKN